MADLITLPRATFQRVLEALERSVKLRESDYDAMEALRAALEQPRQFTSFVPRPPSPPPASQGYDGTEAGLHSFSWRGNE